MSLQSAHEQFGSAFLRWILNIGDDVVLEAHVPDTSQSAALSQLQGSNTVPELFRLRESCGANAAPEHVSEDPLELALVAAADFVYPAFLLALHHARRDPMPAVGLPNVHPQIEMGFYETLRTSSLASIRQKSALLLPTLLFQSWVTATLRGTPDHDSFRKIAISLLQKLRLAEQGAASKASLFIGFAGAKFSGVLTEGNVCLRPLKLREFSAIFPGSAATLAEDTSFVAEVELNYDIQKRFGDAETLGITFARWPVDIALAFALGGVPKTRLNPHEILTRPDLPHAPRRLWLWLVDPLDHNGMHYDGSNPWITYYNVSDAELGEVKATLAHILTRDLSKIRVALGRSMLALQHSRHLEDTLVDAVIAWENIGRVGNDAISFKLSAVIAYLVGNPPVRGNVRSNLANIYSARNKIVHGSLAAPTGQTLLTQAHRALDVSLRAINTMLRDEPRWLTEDSLFDRMFVDDPGPKKKGP